MTRVVKRDAMRRYGKQAERQPVAQDLSKVKLALKSEGYAKGT